MAADAPRGFDAYAAEPVPQAAVGVAGKDGTLELHFEPAGGGTAGDGTAGGGTADQRTALVRDYATVPFHVSGTLDHDPHPAGTAVMVQSPTGGIAQGDRLDVAVDVGADAVAHVTTGAATKVQSMERNYASTDVELTVASGGHLDYVPEPTILHADARYCQDVTVDVAEDATAIVSDVVVPGRLARDERFAFERYHGRVTGLCEGDLLFDDAVRLAPGGTGAGDELREEPRDELADAPAAIGPDAPGVLAEFAVCGTTFVVAPGRETDPLADDLHDAVADGPARAGATALPNEAGVAVRALGETTAPVRRTLHRAWDRARRSLRDVPAPERRVQ